MFHTILTPLDGSPKSEAALPIVAKLARASNGVALLAHVVRSGAQKLTYVSLTPEIGEASPRPSSRGESYLRELSNSPILTRVHIQLLLISGPPALAILDATRTQGADIIVAQARRTHGGLLARIARKAPAPLLALAEDPDHPSLLDGPAEVIVPIDGSHEAEAAIVPAMDIAHALAGPFSPRVRLLCAAGSEVTSAYVRTLTDTFASWYPHAPVTCEQLNEEDLAAGLVARLTADPRCSGDGRTNRPLRLVAVAARRRTGPREWVTESVIQRVLTMTSCPTLIAPSSGAYAKQLTVISASSVSDEQRKDVAEITP